MHKKAHPPAADELFLMTAFAAATFTAAFAVLFYESMLKSKKYN